MKAGKNLERWKSSWRSVRSSRGFHNAVLYLVFVGIAALFWLIMALNDNMTRNLTVGFRLTNVPDTVTFINDPPASFHVTVRDKGTSLLRNGVMKEPDLSFNFKDFSESGIFRLSHTDIMSGLKNLFGTSVQIQSCSLDSLRLSYTANRGKRVPVIVSVDVSAASGYIISGPPIPEVRAVTVFSNRDVLDTITRVYTSLVVKRNLSQTTVVDVKMRSVAGAKLIPNKIKVTIPVEPLVNKESLVVVEAEGVPQGESLLFFPPKVPVSYFVPMSLFNEEELPITVKVNYNEIYRTSGDKVPLKITGYPDYIINPELKTDSVEYSVVKL